MVFVFFCLTIPTVPPAPPPSPLLSRHDALKTASQFCAQNSNPLLCVVGPTASGKTDFSLDLAEKIGGEIINTDSRQFYRGMNIGTAKITPKEMRGIPHHALDFLDPDQDFSVGEFVPIAEQYITEITSRGKIPMLVGGSGLFVDALRKNFEIPAVPPDWDFREKMEQKSNDNLWQTLFECDPETAKKRDKSRRRNIIRALEVIHSTGKKFSELCTAAPKKYNDLVFSLWIPPEVLAERIYTRAEKMVAEGFIDEVRSLADKGFSEQSPAFVAHGYREMMAFLQGECSLSSVLEKMSVATRQYAKRQRTWWRAQGDVVWVQGVV